MIVPSESATEWAEVCVPDLYQSPEALPLVFRRSVPPALGLISSHWRRSPLGKDAPTLHSVIYMLTVPAHDRTFLRVASRPCERWSRPHKPPLIKGHTKGHLPTGNEKATTYNYI
jgi:hypothetical protein